MFTYYYICVHSGTGLCPCCPDCCPQMGSWQHANADNLRTYVQVANAVRASAAAANIIGTEQPCRVRLRLWRCSAADPTATLELPSLTIPDAVLCSEMGVHFSACGRYLAACVACQVRRCLGCSVPGARLLDVIRVYTSNHAKATQKANDGTSW